jgi:hypothetical protein
MAAKGTTNLTKSKKAKILAEKQALSVSIGEIARINGVSRRTVHRVANETDPEVLHLADLYRIKIVEKSMRNVAVGLDVMHYRMFLPETRLGEIVRAVKVGFEIVKSASRP